MVPTRIASALRGLFTRAGTNILIALVAVIAVGASTCGPAYYSSSQVSILRDNLSSAPVLGRGYELTQTGAVGGLLAQVDSEIPGAVGGYGRLFDSPTRAIQTEVLPSGSGTGTSLVWRDGVCDHLTLVGHCPVRPNQVAASRSFSRLLRLSIGSTLTALPYGTFTVTAIYAAPTQPADYWFGQSGLGTYFPFENPAGGHGTYLQDALFTPQSTFEAPSAVSAQGEVDVQSILDADRIRPAQLDALTYAMANINADSELQQYQAVITTDIPQTLAGVRTAWSSLAVPALLVTLQLLGLAWLLLFILVSETVSARGPEIALAKLRGYGPWRAALYGLSEPALIMVASFPLGVLAGWAATDLLAGHLLVPGTPVTVTGAAWSAGLAATFGGLVAIGLASLRSLRRPVIDQWRRSAADTGRAWVLDAVLLTAAVAGLAELVLTGKVSSAHRSSLSLLVPGLLGLAVAVVASRILPLLCRLAVRTGWPRGLVAFLALRWVARRPSGSRTTIMLATSFALATFALAGWSLDQANYERVAAATVGAPAVLDVSVPAGTNLATAVDGAAPGMAAAAVEEYSSNGTTTLAVDPSSWGRVVKLDPAARTALARLDPPEPAPLVIVGRAIRLSLAVNDLMPDDSVLDADLLATGATAPTPVTLATLPRQGELTVSADVAGCPCTLQDITIVPAPLARATPLSGSLTVTSLQQLGSSGWVPLGSGATEAGHWVSADRPAVPDQVRDSPGAGFTWSFELDNDSDATLDYRDQPDPLPALAASAVSAPGPYSAYGLDGSSLEVEVLSDVAVVPGAASNGVVVDRRYAEQAADGNLSVAQDQVWLGAGVPVARVRSGLVAAGVQVLDVQTEKGYRSYLTRQGPGLARVLLLGEAAVVAVLAGAGAILSLYLTARRRRYELAALLASGVGRRVLIGSVAAEAVITVVFGVLVGAATGVGSALVALRDVPEFLVVPKAPSLAVFPPVWSLVSGVGVVVALVVAVSVWAAAALAGRVSLDQLREASQ